MLKIFEDNEAVIKMIIKGRSPAMRHVSRTHRVALDCLFDRINLGPKIQIKYIDTKNQLADILTKGNFTRDEWNHLLCSFNISHFSSINKCKAMSKRTQEVTAKSKPMTNLVSRCRVRDQTVLASTASENPRDTKSESQNVPLSPLMCSKQVRGDPYLTSWSSILICHRQRIGLFSKIPFIPAQSERPIAKMLNRSPEDLMQDIDKRSMIWGMFMPSTVDASEFMGKNCSDNLHSNKNTREISL